MTVEKLNNRVPLGEAVRAGFTPAGIVGILTAVGTREVVAGWVAFSIVEAAVVWAILRWARQK